MPFSVLHMLKMEQVQFLLVPCEHAFSASGVLQFATRTFAGASTQNLLNEAEAPTDRDLAVGYGEILLALAVTMVRTSILYTEMTLPFHVLWSSPDPN
jgi:hypothetical protein